MHFCENRFNLLHSVCVIIILVDMWTPHDEIKSNRQHHGKKRYQNDWFMNTDINSAWNQHLFQLSWLWCFIFCRQTGVYPLYEIADKEVCNLLQRDAAIPLGISKFMQLRFPHYTLQNFISLYHTSLTRNFFYFTNKNEWLWKLDRTSRFRAVPCYITPLYEVMKLL